MAVRQDVAGCDALDQFVHVGGFPGGIEKRLGGVVRGVADDHHLSAALQNLVGAKQPCQREEVLGYLPRESGEDILGAGTIGVFAGQIMEARQRSGDDAVAGGRGIVGGRLCSDDQRFGVVGGEEIPAAIRIPEMRIDHVDPFAGGFDIGRVAGGFVQCDGGPRHVGIVIQCGGVFQLAGAEGVQQTAVRLHAVADEGEGGNGGIAPVGLAEHAGGVRQGGDHHPVPVGQHLVVPSRPYAPVADRQQFLARR